MKLTDAKFLVEAKEVEERSVLQGHQLHGLQVDSHSTPNAGLEPVSFMHPHRGQRVYGWLSSVDYEGNARVELGDGEYAIVPPRELKRIGGRRERAEVIAELRRTIGTSTESDDGVRADFAQTAELIPLEDETLQLLSLSYAATCGTPTLPELEAYVRQVYPGARVVEMDGHIPGHIGVALEFDDGERTAQLEQSMMETDESMQDDSDEPSQDSPMEAEPEVAGHADELLKEGDSFCVGASGPCWEVVKAKGASGYVKRTDQKKKWWGYSQFPELHTVEIYPVAQLTGSRSGGSKYYGRVVMQNGDSTEIQPPAMSTPQMSTMAEMPPAVGGDVIETLDPQEDVQAPPRTAQVRRQMASSEVAQILARNAPNMPEAQRLMTQAIQVYMKNGGAEQIAKSTRPMSAAQIVQAALPIVVKQDANLWKTISNHVASNSPDRRGPAAPGVGNPQVTPNADPGAAASPPGTGPTTQGVNPGMAPGINGNGPAAGQAGPMPPGGPAFPPGAQPPGVPPVPSSSNSPPPPQWPPRASALRSRAFDKEAKYNMGPSQGQIARSMYFSRMARRGDYIVATVKWEPSIFEDAPQGNIPHAVVSFVKAKASRGPSGGQDFGFIGKVHVTSLRQDNGEADVQFQSLSPGAAPLEVADDSDGKVAEY